MARRSWKRAGKEHLDGSPNHQVAQEQPTAVNDEKPQLLYPETESTLSKDPEINIVEEREVKKVEGEERNEPNQFRNEPDSTPSKETITKSVSDLDSEHHDLCPKLDPLSPQKTNPVPLPVNETNGLSTEPDSTTSRKKRKKKKGKSLSSSEGTKTNNVHFEHRELIPNLDPFSRKDLDPVLLPEPEPAFVKNDTNGLSTETESTTSRKKNGKSLSSIEGTEANNVHFEHHELTPNVDPVSQKDSDPVLLPEPEPVAEKNETNQLCTETELAAPRKKRKGKSLSTSEVTETSNVHLEHRELFTNLDPLFPKDSDPILLPEPEPEPVADKNETNQLCTEQESATGRKKRKRKGKSISTSEVIETNFVHFGHRESIPNLDPLPPKDYSSLLLEPEPVAEKNETSQLCTEKKLVTPRKKKSKRKGKSMSTSEGVEANHVDSEHRVPCHNLAALPPKDQDLLLLPEPGLGREKNEANQLCTKPESTSPKFEGADIKNMDSENLKLCPELDPLPLKHSDPLLLPELQLALVKEVEPRKKKKKKKKKNKGELEGEGAETNRPSNEHSQKCHKAKPKTLEEQNQRKRNRQAMNDVWSMVTPNYRTRPRRATVLDSEAVGCGPWIPKRPLKDYECYERCLECKQLCQSGQTCRRKLPKNSPTCFFCGASGHLLQKCPLSPGAKCANGIIMLDDFVRKKCWRKSERTEQQVAPANVPTLPPSDLYAY